MYSPQTDNGGPIAELIEQVMKKEWDAVQAYRSTATSSAHPELQTLFIQLAGLRERIYRELEEELSKVKSESEITGQINSMFL
jgi:rubrerythrin